MFGNKYYLVPDDVELIVWIKTGSKPGNSYFGTSRIYDVIAEERKLQPEDELHYLVGGMFLVTAEGTTHEVLSQSPDRQNQHFLRDYEGPHGRYQRMLRNLIEIPSTEATIPTSYGRA